MPALKQAVPIAVSMYALKFASKQASIIPGLDRLGRHAPAAVAVALIPASAWAAKMAKLKPRWKTGLAMGAGLNALDVLLRTYMPANVKEMLGMNAVGDYVEIGDYVGIGAYEAEMGDYVGIGDTEGYSTSLGAEEDLGQLEQELGTDWQELGASAADEARMDSFSSSQIGSGIGTPRSSHFMKAIPARAFAAPVPDRSFVKAVPPATAKYDSAKKVYTGIFGGGYGC
jgi:hypothetical protein